MGLGAAEEGSGRCRLSCRHGRYRECPQCSWRSDFCAASA